jgi:hypothetical protein
MVFSPEELDRIAKTISEFLREMGVLWFTFGVLDPALDWTLHSQPGQSGGGTAAVWFGLAFIAAGALVFAFGVAVDLRWRRGIDPFTMDE